MQWLGMTGAFVFSSGWRALVLRLCFLSISSNCYFSDQWVPKRQDRVPLNGNASTDPSAVVAAFTVEREEK